MFGNSSRLSCVGQVRFSAKHLLRIITDILDFSKIEAGKLEMEDIQFSLYDQLEHAVSVLAARAKKKGLELACQVDHAVPDQIIGDPGRLFQVFVNLIGKLLFFPCASEHRVCPFRWNSFDCSSYYLLSMQIVMEINGQIAHDCFLL